ncbi:MAG: hypothetical protein Q8L88_06935 [Bacteroidota bacterium]|nr:hypothetical protein [Bacteroidota bacterium]
MNILKIFHSVIFLLLTLTVASTLVAQQKATTVDLKKEYGQTIVSLMDALQKRQITDKKSADYGAIQCYHCNILHTRAAESVYPFVVAYQISGEKRFLQAAVATGNWLIKKQEVNGSWKETPEEWTGTTTDQLLMFLEAWPLMEKHLSKVEQVNWKKAIIGAADYITSVMNHEFASINYCATSTASLARANSLFPDERYLTKARWLAHMIASKMNDDGFIDGEGGYENGTKRGSDLGYEMDMSLWGMAYYARLTNDAFIDSLIRHSVSTHLSFILPDGIMDDSWGSRSNKWTTFGSATSDGVQVLFALLANADLRYAAAAFANLQNIRKNITDGLIGYGPHYSRVMSKPPCIYTTFAKAKNLAMAYSIEQPGVRKLETLPTEEKPWLKVLPFMNVAQVRTQTFISTVTAYNYKDGEKRDKSKYMHRPTGGAASLIWADNFGMLQAASQTKYIRVEPMHFPEVDSVACMTPRIEYSNKRGYFTNLYEFDAMLQSKEISHGNFSVFTKGELRDKRLLAGGIGYSINYLFKDSSYSKSIQVVFHDDLDTVSIIEPFVHHEGMVMRRVDATTVEISYPNAAFQFKISEGDVTLIVGEGEQYYWSPYPAIKAYPIIMTVAPPVNGFKKKVAFSVTRMK